VTPFINNLPLRASSKEEKNSRSVMKIKKRARLSACTSTNDTFAVSLHLCFEKTSFQLKIGFEGLLESNFISFYLFP
jgi:hypothetical protein